jgi:hypothetical protein
VIEHEHINSEFQAKANNVANYLLKDFELAVNRVDRRNDEYLFQQLKNKYVNTLKQRLEMLATQLVQDNQANQRITDIDQHLNVLIKTQLHQFVQRIKDF